MEKAWNAKKAFSRLGFGALAILVITTALQGIFAAIVIGVFGKNHIPEMAKWVITFVPMYLVAVPIGLSIMKKVPEKERNQGRLTVGEFFIYFCIGYFWLTIGNFLGINLLKVLQSILGHTISNPIESFLDGKSVWLSLVFVSIFAPMVEEFIFRKVLIDRMRVYGDTAAIVVSALMFGLFHGNFSQFFYAFFLGILFGYIYTITGKLRYSVMMHMIVNFLGGVVGSLFLKYVNRDVLTDLSLGKIANITPGQILPLILYGLYTVIIFIIIIVGLILSIVKAKTVVLERGESPRGAIANPGMICFIIASGIMIIISFTN